MLSGTLFIIFIVLLSLYFCCGIGDACMKHRRQQERLVTPTNNPLQETKVLSYAQALDDTAAQV